ncbi:MAG: NADH-quinone oxidoreductase subunit E [Albidovulum sp.]
MLRRLYHDQPASFEFTPANLAWAKGQMTKYPEGRQASAVIPLLWRAQEQEGWLTRPAIEYVAAMLDMPKIRVLEVATFYFMFQLQPVGSVAHIQICGTTSCMICGAEDLIRVCREKIAPTAHALSADGKFSWEEVECLGACTNAPMAQIGKDYYEDLTAEGLAKLIDEMAAGKVPVPGPQNGRYASEPLKGLTSLKEFESGRRQYNGSVQRAVDLGDSIKRIDGTEVPLLTPWLGVKVKAPAAAKPAKPAAKPAAKAEAKPAATPAKKAEAPKAADIPAAPKKPRALKAPRKGGADDLKLIKGVGPKLEELLHSLGFFHFDQIAAWTEAELAWVDDNLEGFKGRASRDEWVAQARHFAAGGTTEHAERVKKGDA